MPELPPARVRVTFVDVYVLRRHADALQALVLRRSAQGRCPGTWECVHGSIEPGETAVAAAIRELREETGLAPARLYNLSRVEAFYLHRQDEVALIPVFVALVGPDGEVVVSEEHDASEWLAPVAAAQRVTWPRVRRGLEDAATLLATGDAGPVEDVLRIC